MAQKVEIIKGRRIQPPLTPPKGGPRPKHPLGGVRLGPVVKGKTKRTIKDRGNRSV